MEINNDKNEKKSNINTKWDAKTYIGCLVFIFIFAIIFRQCFCSHKSNVNDSSKVINNEWDSSVWQVEKYLKVTLKDPDSYKGIDWSAVKDLGEYSTAPHRYIVRHKFKAKNSYGIEVIENKMFYLDTNGQVINIMNFGE